MRRSAISGESGAFFLGSFLGTPKPLGSAIFNAVVVFETTADFGSCGNENPSDVVDNVANIIAVVAVVVDFMVSF
jgi:hypothetical protein